MKINKIFILLALVAGMLFTSCEDFLETEPENRLTEAVILADPAYAEGLLMNAYVNMPVNYNFFLDITCDDAITNVQGSFANTMVSGGWSAQINPFQSDWDLSYEMFLYLNKFMDIIPEVEWDWRSATRDSVYRVRLKGEAHALRAWWGFYLLQRHGGMSDGQLLGYPILTEVIGIEDDYKLPRNTYEECINQIISDLDSAIIKLPLIWENKGRKEEGYLDHNATLGNRNINRVNGLAAKALKSRVLLYAASPAFASSDITWEEAAQAAAAVMDDKEGLDNLDASDVEFYKNMGSDEIIWASSRRTDRSDWETNNFPPSMYGSGLTNPTQNLVNAFPMLDGTPFSDNLQDSASQYDNRDPRLEKYVLYNGAIMGDTVLRISSHDPNNPDANGLPNATLSGYYLKKFINQAVDISPGQNPIGADHFYTYARYTEVLLNFAEAANEAQGPDVEVYGYTAQDVVNAIRTRAGITSTDYIMGLDKDGLREAIKNERRIELCFEEHRFWDIRRWNDTDDMKSSIEGIRMLTDTTGFTDATVFEIKKQNYADYQIYGPIPYFETLKYDIKQNDGW